jgi:hypothetical protein
MPSSKLQVEDSIAAHCLDDCVLHFGLLVENTLGEREKVGMGKDEHWEAKYELNDLLDPDFRVPREAPKPAKGKQMGGIAALMALASQKGSGVKLWAPVKPS